jgi:hypothetical protein
MSSKRGAQAGFVSGRGITPSRRHLLTQSVIRRANP